jgi:MSHA biogenesis protein MshQ
VLDKPPQPTWTGAGTVTTSNLVYREVGAFNWELEDRTFSAADSGDSTISERYFRSNAVRTAGRFVPDHFAVGTTTLVPRSDIAGCAGSTFTYMNEPMQLSVQLIPQEATANATTRNYVDQTKLTTGTPPNSNLLALGSNNSWGLWAAGINVAGNAGCRAVFGAASPFNTTLLGCAPVGWPVSPYPAPASRISTASPTITWSTATPGTLTLATQLTLSRANAVDGPLGTLSIGMAPQDTDAVTLAAASLNLDADTTVGSERASVATTNVRHGRLRLQNAYGSELLPIRVPLQAEYWNTNRWERNPDDSCTTLPSNAIALGNYLTPPAGTAVSAANMGVAPVDHRPAGPVTLANGSATIVLAPPVPVATGSFDVVLNLGTGLVSPNSCEPATAVFGGGTASSLSYLLGNWCGVANDRAPSARIKLGSPKASYIYMRERY